MPQKYKKKRKQNNVLFTIITAILLCVVFLWMVGLLYERAEDAAYEHLHEQTKQIKDDLQLQIKSDNENLQTLANFAAKLYSDNESYDLMFKSFKPIGLIEDIGILTQEGMFITKHGSINLGDSLPFSEEIKKAPYVSNKLTDVTNPELEIIRSAMPVKHHGKTVAVLYGAIRLDRINERYAKMAEELDAQLFVYDRETGELIIDTINDYLGNISALKDRTYNNNTSFDDITKNPNGYLSFESVYRDSNAYAHFSTLDIAHWSIMVVRYEEQVFEQMNATLLVLITTFIIMAAIIVVYILIVTGNEKNRTAVTAASSLIRKNLLEINQQKNVVAEALRLVMTFSKSRSAIFVDTDGEDYNYALPAQVKHMLIGEDRQFFVSRIFDYIKELQKTNTLPLITMSIKTNAHLRKTNNAFYAFLKEHGIKKVTCTAVVDKAENISLLGVVNPKVSSKTRVLLEDIAFCFSIAVFNKKHLNETKTAVMTDALTGVLNRVAYKRDLDILENSVTEKLACLYIDVNELHMHNNRFGHTAGDQMLLYIATTLKEVFFGNSIYRMGGDEFLVFVQGEEADDIKERINVFTEKLKPMNYHVAIGMSYRANSFSIEEMVKEAEVRMYEAKAGFYQNKKQKSVSETEDVAYAQIKTGIKEIDAMLKVMKEHYRGIYRVSLDTDEAHRILMPAYLGYNEDEKAFSKILKKYIEEWVNPDFRRSIMSFLNYSVIKKQLSEGIEPSITYKKVNAETVTLTVYPLDEKSQTFDNTLWVFSKD